MWIRRLQPIDPFEAAHRLRVLGDVAFLDSAQPDSPLSRRSILAAAPFHRFTIAPDGPGLAELQALLARYRHKGATSHLPGAAIGYFAYDLAHRLERLAPPRDYDDQARLADFGLYGTILEIDLQTGETLLCSAGFSDRLDASAPEKLRCAEAEQQFDSFEAALAATPAPLADNPPVTGFTSDFSREAYDAAVEKVRSYIRDGDIYQANIAQTFTAAIPPGFDTLAFHRTLRQRNPAPFAAYLETANETIVSSSPERFLALNGDAVETRPIKGTIRRDADSERDRAAAKQLAESVKDRAENIMIVDLLRNDLARACLPDSVEVPVLCGVESYASVHHLVSVVTGRLKPELDMIDLVAASFPGGSITGAPKIRAMDIITEIENRLRGVYCGSIGYLGFNGAMDLNIAIRTVGFSAGKARLSAGGGITILSEPASEYDESLAKAARLLEAFEAGA